MARLPSIRKTKQALFAGQTATAPLAKKMSESNDCLSKPGWAKNTNTVALKTSKQQQIKTLCQQYAQGFETALKNGQSLILCGKTGTGKNHLAAAICQCLMQKNYTALLVKASHYLDAYWSKAFDERMTWLQAIASVDLFILDELGKSSQAKTAQDALFRLIDARYENCKPTLLTTNLNREGLLEVLGEAAFDRLTEGGGMRLTLNWASFRNQKTCGGNG